MQEQPSPVQKKQLEFTGKGSEYFKIWSVNILLTICTLYIYSAWAKVRSKRYFYGNTVLDGSSFEYHATGKQLLPGRLIGLALFLAIVMGEYISMNLVLAGYALLAVLLPWAMCRSGLFNARMSSYRNIRFDFTGKAGKFYLYMFLLPLVPFVIIGAIWAGLHFTGMISEIIGLILGTIAVLSFYAMVPWVYGKLSIYKINQSQYGTAQFSTDLKTRRFIFIYAKAAVLSLAVISVFIAVGFGVFKVFGPALVNLYMTAGGSPLISILGIALVYAVMLPAGTLLRAFLESRVRNTVFNNTELDGKFHFLSEVKTLKLWWIELSNVMLLIFTLGLAYPWAAVRKARFMANHTQVISKHNADQFIASEGQKISAMGEEIGDAFDMDVAAGF